jgi:hypothetical protein
VGDALGGRFDLLLPSSHSAAGTLILLSAQWPAFGRAASHWVESAHTSRRRRPHSCGLEGVLECCPFLERHLEAVSQFKHAAGVEGDRMLLFSTPCAPLFHGLLLFELDLVYLLLSSMHSDWPTPRTRCLWYCSTCSDYGLMITPRSFGRKLPRGSFTWPFSKDRVASFLRRMHRLPFGLLGVR